MSILTQINETKLHWEAIYENKTPDQVSWTQELPETSLKLIRELPINKNSSIIDIGGGDSRLVDCLLELGYTDITVLDISSKAIERAQKRLGENAQKVGWIVSDVLDFVPQKKYDVWHDRAAFHFLIEQSQIEKYQNKINEAKAKNVIISTFSTDGPLKCSGLEIKQYSKEMLDQLFSNEFQMLGSVNEKHLTPFGTTQDFIFVSLQRK